MRGALIFFENFKVPHPHELAMNPRGLKSDRLRVIGQQDANPILHKMFPDRPAFVILGDDPYRPIPLEPPARIAIAREARLFHKQVGKDKLSDGGGFMRVAQEGRDPKGWICFGKVIYLPRAAYVARWLGDCKGISEGHPFKTDVYLSGSKQGIAYCEISGDRANVLAEFAISLTNEFSAVSPCMKYGGSGELVVRAFSVEERLE